MIIAKKFQYEIPKLNQIKKYKEKCSNLISDVGESIVHVTEVEENEPKNFLKLTNLYIDILTRDQKFIVVLIMRLT